MAGRGYSGREYVQEFERRESNLGAWRSTWQDVAEYVMPRKAFITRTLTPGVQNMDKVLDGTAIQANELLSASMQGSLTSSSIQWFRLRAKGVDLAPGSEEDRWLEHASKRMYDFIRYSNFVSEGNEFYQDLSGVGTGNIFLEESPRVNGAFAGFRFRSIDVGSYMIEEDFEGRVVGVYRKFSLSARVAVARWGEKVNEEARKAAGEGNKPEQPFEFLHVVRPRDLATYGMGPTARPFVGCYVDVKAKEKVEESGYFEQPYLVARWSKKSGDEWGTGPGLVALPDVKTLNKLVELKLAAMGKMVNPPLMMRDQGVTGPVRLTPGGLTHVRDMDAVKPLDITGRGFQFAEIDEEKLQIKVRGYFHNDQLQLRDGPQMTATESQIRWELMQRILGPTLGRVESEFQNPMIERIFGIMLRAQMFPPMPASLQTLYKQGRLDIEYEGPLARAARLSDSLAIQRFWQITLPVAQAFPEALDKVDIDGAMDIHAEALAVPAKAIRPMEKVLEIRAARQAAQEQAVAEAREAGYAEALGKIAPFIKASQDATSGAAGVPPTLAGRI